MAEGVGRGRPSPPNRLSESPAVAVPRWIPAYVGLGSNLDDPAAQVRTALAGLATLPESRLIARSPLFRNPPLGGIEQPDFVNGVAGLLTRLSAPDLLAQLLALETRQGRLRDAGVRWAARRIDLDLLVYGDHRLSLDHLEVPHPGIAARNFVLLPLLAIAPGLDIPGLGPVRRLAAAAGGPALVPVG
ncbi:MAG: 2-amino-4-hydroxy-6-hydroxymethyldihydropteridine diphosphokinase [Gammaproteobacteria bacterium]|nr:2-amino-4-hydroxy-6-hydroxymethyldihydropteridine diphosphokinase [Gammaproteobacteria bacterium]